MISKIENQPAGPGGWTALLGVMFVFIGIGALAFPFLTTFTIEFFAGFTLLIAGAVTMFHAFSAKAWSGFFMQLLTGVLYILGGLFFLVDPLGGAIAMTVALGFVFFFEGIARSALAFDMKPAENWGWVLASGGLSIVIGVIIMAGIANAASLAFVGLLFGVNFISAGVSFIMLGMQREETEIVSAT